MEKIKADEIDSYNEYEEEEEEEESDHETKRIGVKSNLDNEFSHEGEYEHDEDADEDKSGKDGSEVEMNREDNLRIELEDNLSGLEADKLHELLFCVQGIGKYTDDKRTVYEKGKYCEPSMRDIHRFLRKDDPENPSARYSVLAWRAAENDIIPVILNYENNEKIQQLGLVLLVDITESLSDIVEYRHELEVHLTALQEYIVNSKLVELLSRTLADSTAKMREASIMRNELKIIEHNEENKFSDLNEEEIAKASEIKQKIAEVENKSQTMIELIFVLFKQILNIVTSHNIDINVKNNISLLKKFAANKIFDAIVFHSQSFESEFSKNLATTILEFVYFLVRPFTAGNILNLLSEYNANKTMNNTNKPVGMTILQRMVEEERQQKAMRQAMYSTRPNSFSTMIKVNRPIDNSSFVVGNVTMLQNYKTKVISDKMNNFTQQKKRPKKGMNILKNKKDVSKATEEIKLVNDLKIMENFTASIDYTYGDVISGLQKFCENFLKNCLNQLIKHFNKDIKESESLEKYDYYHIVSLMTFFLDFNRFNEHSKINNLKLTSNHIFESEAIRECLNFELIDYAYNVCYSESLKSSSSERKSFELYASLRFLKQILLTSFDLYKYKSDSNLELNVMIQDHLIIKDFSKIIRGAFAFYNENYHPKKILYELIEFTEIYLAALEMYSNKRKLTIKTKKRRKNKEIEKEEDLLQQMRMEEFIEGKDGEEDKSEHTGSVCLSDDSDHEYLEREADVNEETKLLLEYSIITRIFSIFNQANPNSLITTLNELKRENVVKFIVKLFERIIKKIKEPWVFYQMEYLYTIHYLLNESIFTTDPYFLSLQKILHEITKSFFTAMSSNKLLAIESLFRFPNAIIKDSILSNYDAPVEEYNFTTENEYVGNNLYEAEEEYDGNNIEMVKVTEDKKMEKKQNKPAKEDSIKQDNAVWTENEDLLLIRNYFEFKDYPDIESLLDKLFPLKSFREIKSRMKTLRLKKGEKKAMKMFKKIYKKRKEKDEKLFNIIIELSDECRDENKKNKIQKTLNSLRGQLESYKVRKGLLNNSKEVECVLIPNSEEEVNILEDNKFKHIIKNIGLVHDGKSWSVDPKSDTYEISIIIDKLDNLERVIQENVEVEDEEREQERIKAKKEKKLKKKKDKKHRKRKQEFEMKEEDKESDQFNRENYSKQSQSVKNEYSINLSSKTKQEDYEYPLESSKKKKKLKKGLKEPDEDLI